MSSKTLMMDLKNVLYVDRIYSSLEILRNRNNDPSNKEVNLTLSELRLFSQNGEDGILHAILSLINDSNPYFVEFGVGDGWSCNCRLLAEAFGWGGNFWEISESEFILLQQRYVHSNKITCAKEIVSSGNINELFEKYQVPNIFGVLSIDIDGQDYWVWKALDTKYQPDVVVIEFNSALDPNKSLVEEEALKPGLPLGKTWGASHKALLELGIEKGYRQVHSDMAGVNLFFVREQIIKSKQLKLLGNTSPRSPNYGLRGKNHSDKVLFGASQKSNRPQINFDGE